MVFILLFTLLVTACSSEQSISKETSWQNDTEQAKSSGNERIVTDDGKITFEIINNVEASKEKVEKIKKEILQAYNDITNSIKTDYVPAKEIDILLLQGNAPSFGSRKEIILYSITDDNYPLVHELTHTLLGYGEDFDRSRGFLTQEGLFQ
ncbi:hypothetical protein ACW2QC_01935 [Virgibacillus sp. FSP13]